MKNTVKGLGALLLAAALFACFPASAEEKQWGNLIYVPAMNVSGAMGSIRLTVEGLSLQADSDEPLVVSPLAGAEFGVYVYSSAGVLTPWANPLFPSEPMRIRTGEGETLFSLPKDTEFYLKQESAPQGYLYDPEALIPVTGEQIVVANAMPGQLIARVEDELGAPVPGVELTFTDESGAQTTARTDENGEAALSCDGGVEVRESALPDGVFGALSAAVSDALGEQTEDFGLSDGEEIVAQAKVGAASRAHVTFVHPAAGSARLIARLSTIGEDAQKREEPLAGVRLSIVGDEAQSVVTDADGEESLALLEGVYEMRVAYEGEEDAVLPFSEGTLIVRKGEETAVELTAAQSAGRIAIEAQSARVATGGAVVFEGTESGASYGPYAFDADGLLVSDPLAPGDYRIAAFEAPEEMELGRLIAQDQIADDIEQPLLRVEAGEVTSVVAELLSWESQPFEVLSLTLADDGGQVYQALGEEMEFALLDAEGSVVGSVTSQEGRVQVSALSGAYALRMEADAASRLGLKAESRPFNLPSEDDAIVFAGDSARLLLYSVDEDGMALAGARYRITDGSGKGYDVETDGDGEAVTPPLAPGEIEIETLASPSEHDAAERASLIVQAGDATSVSLSHPSFGEALLSVCEKRLNGRGEEQTSPLSGVGIRLYRVSDDGAQVTDMDMPLVSGEDGTASVRLPQGEYIVQADASTLGAGLLPPQAARISVRNTLQTAGELTCLNALGGVRATMTGGELSDGELAQIRFELTASDGSAIPLSLIDGAFYAGDLPEGTYVLRQTQIPQGYTLAAERTVSVSGGQVALVQVPLEEYAVLAVRKTGLTFNDQLQTFIVPLSGEYGVYTMEDGQLCPYPSADAQATVWANVTAEQAAQGLADSVRLPAGVEGRTYYLREIGGSQGFAADETSHEVTLVAGQQAVVECAVSSDRGFFLLDQTDASGAHVAGGRFELLDGDGESVLSFEMGDTAYQNPMAVPVGTYTLRQTDAAPGCAMPAEPETQIAVEPYLTRGGTVTHAQMACARIPQNPELSLIGDLYGAREQGLTVVNLEGGALAMGETLRKPQLTLRVSGANGERVNAISVMLSGVRDAAGNAYAARVEYCLSDGGWQPSDARWTPALDVPTTVSIDGVRDDVCAIRITYLDAATGLELAQEGFTPGNVSIGLRTSAEGGVRLEAEASFEGALDYRTALGSEDIALERGQSVRVSFDSEGDGVFDTAVAGRDGRISGTAFGDADADGLLLAGEDERFADLSVALLDASGTVVDETTTDAQGHYAFSGLSAGTYSVRFDAAEGIIFSSNDAYSEHISSGVQDAREGVCPPVLLDADHTDAIVNAGCVYASRVSGQVAERLNDGVQVGYSGMHAELYAADVNGEPAIALTGETGEFGFDQLMPGRYALRLTVPDGYLCADAQDGVIEREIELAQGDAYALDEVSIQRAASVSGCVRVDDDGDGTMEERADVLPGVRVSLLCARDGHTEQTAQTVTDADGRYAFGNLPEGEYSVLFELNENWVFTRYGADSLVFGSMSQTGSTQSFALSIGQQMERVDAGATIPAELTVLVFKDTRLDGQYDGNEAMLDGVDVTLMQLSEDEVAQENTLRTDESGAVTFTVSPGDYRIRYRMPGAWRATVNKEPGEYPVSCVPQSAANSGESGDFALTMGQSGVRLYIGAMLTGSISGTAYYDDNADAKRGEEEAPANGVLAELLNMQEQVVAETETVEDGSYAFEGLAPGRYRVRFTSESGSYFSASERSLARGGVQESEENTSSTRPIPVYAGEATSTADAGVVRFGRISGYIWEDSDANSERDEEEPSLAGVEVHLTKGASRTLAASAVTDENGAFSFEGVQPGDYVLRVDAPEAYVFSGAAQGGPLQLAEVREGRGYSAPFTMLGGAHAEGVGFGLFKQGAIAGRVWDDADYSGTMEEAEDGLRYASVTLLNAAGEEVASVQTGRSGEFLFDHLRPDEYALSVTLPQGYVYTAQGGNSRAARQDAVQTSVQIGVLEMGQTIDGVNIGALLPASVSGMAWYDADDDGRRQNSDAPVQNVGVRLEMLSGADAGKTYETQTDALGAYAFSGVLPGDARLVFELSDGSAFARQAEGRDHVSVVPQTDALVGESGTFGIAAGSRLTDRDVGVVSVGVISGTVWEDAAYDGAYGSGERGVEGAKVSLLSAATGEGISSATSDANGAYAIGFVRQGAYIIQVELPDGRIFTRSGESAVSDVDVSIGHTQAFSLTMGEGVSRLNIGAISPAVIEGRLFLTQGAAEGEDGLPDAVVSAVQGGTVVSTARSGKDGTYRLDTLRPGTYRMRITLPEDTLFALDTPLTLASARSQEGETDAVTLSMGQRYVFDAFAAVRTGRVSGCAWEDGDADGRIGGQEPALTGISVALYELMNDEMTLIVRTQTDSNGCYEFDLVRGGEYTVCFTLPEEMLFTDKKDGTDASSVTVVPGNVGSTDVFTLAPGERLSNINAGGILPGLIGDTVWLDVNGNGLQDYREPLVPDVGVTLLRPLEDGTFEEVSSLRSDEYGYYHFSALRPGHYVVRLDDEGYSLTRHFGEPLGEIDSDLDPETRMSADIPLNSGQTLLNIDIGLASGQ